MVGGNPKHDHYGFRYWNNPGAFQEYRTTGTLGRFEGFLSCLWSASFTVVGPEYISMVAAEAKRPRIYIKAAFKTVYYRFALFFMGSALCVGIVVSHLDPVLVAIVTGESSGGGTAAASPYVIACRNLGIGVFPHIINALLCTSIFSAGNTYTYCATRTLYGLALEGRAPRFFQKCTKSGVPIYCFAVTMLFPLLSFLQVGNSSSIVLGWLVALVTAGGVIDYIVMGVTYIFFYRACIAQGLDRKTFPYYGYFQPYCAYIGTTWMVVIVFTYGYACFKPWSVGDFFANYLMLLLAPCTFTFWKLFKRTKFVKPHEADLVWEKPIVDAYEESFLSPPDGFWKELLGMVGIGRKKYRDRRSSTASY